MKETLRNYVAQVTFCLYKGVSNSLTLLEESQIRVTSFTNYPKIWFLCITGRESL